MPDLFTPFINHSIRDTNISTKYSQRVIQDVDVPHSTERDEYLGTSLSHVKSILLLAACGLSFIIVLARIFYLQVMHGTEYREVAEGNRIRIEYLSAARGVIFDDANSPLVKNVPNFTVTITPSNLPKDTEQYQAVLIKTANVLETPVNDLENAVQEHAETLYSQPLALQDSVPYERALKLSTQLSALPGVQVEVQAAREYTEAEVYSHVLGYLGSITEDDLTKNSSTEYLLTDSLGKTGLEYEYEDQLRGDKGRRQIEVNASGTDIEVIAKEDPRPGSNMVLAINSNLQKTLFQALADYSITHNVPGGAAVALDPRTGAIKALVSFPGYDANAFSTGIDQTTYEALIADERKPLFNKAVSGEYPSGSTFKLIVAAAALQEQVVTPESTVDSTGGIEINQWYFPDWKTGGHGRTDVRKALAESVNTYFYLAGGGTYDTETLEIKGGLGIDRINAYGRLFGLGDRTGIDLPGEARGFLPTPNWKESVKQEPWYIGDTYHVSIGQGDLLVTPLQVALYTSAIANGGIVYKPYLVNHVTNEVGDAEYSTTSEILHSNFINSYYLQVVREGMRQAVTFGSARRLSTLPISVAGKTGTAQIGGTTRTHSWFTSFAPYDNPELVLTVLVEEGGEGTEAALPIAQRALAEYFSESSGADE